LANLFCQLYHLTQSKIAQFWIFLAQNAYSLYALANPTLGLYRSLVHYKSYQKFVSNIQIL
jgi:hypothetical protein